MSELSQASVDQAVMRAFKETFMPLTPIRDETTLYDLGRDGHDDGTVEKAFFFEAASLIDNYLGTGSQVQNFWQQRALEYNGGLDTVLKEHTVSDAVMGLYRHLNS